MRRSSRSRAVKTVGWARPARSPKKRSLPASKASRRPCRNNRGTRRESTRTGRKNPGRQAIQRVPSSEGPPPGTTQWMCGWCCKVCPQVWSTAEMAWIGGDGGKRLGRAAEQDCIDGGLVLEGDLARWRRQGENDMEVRYRQQFGLSGGEALETHQPLALRAVAFTTGVVGIARQPAVVAPLDMAAERRCPARRDGTHDAPLDAAEMTGM